MSLEANRDFNLDDVLHGLLSRLSDVMDASLAEVMEQYQSLLLGLDQTCTVDVMGKEMKGCLAGVSPEGRLLLETETGRMALGNASIRAIHSASEGFLPAR